MKGLGTLVNVLAIIVAGGVGVMLRGKLKTRYQELLLQCVGLAAIVYGAWYLWDGLMILQSGQLETTGTLLVMFALLVGTVFGEAFALERGLIAVGRIFRGFSEKEEEKEQLRRELEEKKKAMQAQKAAQEAQGAVDATAGALPDAAVKGGSAGQAGKQAEKPKRRTISELPTYDLDKTRTGHLFVDGFLMATLLCAVSGMAFRGAVADGLDGSTTTLFIKAAIDAVLVFALATVYGSGVTFAALPVLLVEGLMTLLSIFVGDLLTMTLMNQLVLIASVMTMATGVNLAFGKKLRVANAIPALLIPPIYGLVMMLVERFIGE